MASPLNTGKQPVKLAAHGAQGPRVSKIRRDPPPIAKQTVVPDRDERDGRMVPIGIIAFALAIVTAIIGLASYGGWSPSQVTVEIGDKGTL